MALELVKKYMEGENERTIQEEQITNWSI
jgi:hypothetical protein